ncbi:hypothetical protein IAT38_001477 [Cryptococcus sp. DSM 104549]
MSDSHAPPQNQVHPPASAAGPSTQPKGGQSAPPLNLASAQSQPQVVQGSQAGQGVQQVASGSGGSVAGPSNGHGHALHAQAAPTPAPALASQAPASQTSAPQASSSHHVPQPFQTLQHASGSMAPSQEMDHQEMDTGMLDEDEGFDPATLANLAALSRIINDDEDEDDNGLGGSRPSEEDDIPREDELETRSPPRHDGPLTREQVQEFVDHLSREKGKERARDGEEGEGEEELDAEERTERYMREKALEREREHERRQGERNREEQYQEGEEEQDEQDRPGADDAAPPKKQRKRMRNTLSCTECHRRCDRNIPCSRCKKRGIPNMCRMEHPVLPPRKKRKYPDDEDINYELGQRVRILENLLRSAGSLDAAQASEAARETIRHATRAANAGSHEAHHALSQLTQSGMGLGGTGGLGGMGMGGVEGMGGLSQEAQNSLLLDVLQQLSAASTGKPLGMPDSRAEGRKGLALWSTVPDVAIDTITETTAAFEADDDPDKMNLCLPGFREDNGNLFIPPTVRYIENKLRTENILAKEALPIEGYAPFIEAGLKFAYGSDSAALRHRRIAAIQAISLTGAYRVAGSFLSRITPPKVIFVPLPSLDEDIAALKQSGLEVRSYRFLDISKGGVDWDGMREDLQDAPPKAVVLVHVGGSMPSGAELTANQWRLLATLMTERSMIALGLMAYQGLTTGDVNRDAQGLRFMVHEGIPVVLIQCFDAMMGLYADSPTLISVVTQNTDDRDRVNALLRSIARSNWLHPSPWGAHVAHQILTDARLYPAWLAEIKAMSDRLRSVREKLHDLLVNKLRTPGEWGHLKRPSGMYCTPLLAPPQSDALTTKRHIYLLPEGCFNLGSLNAPKIDLLSRAIDYVVRLGIKEQEEAQARRIQEELAVAAARAQRLRDEAQRQAEREAQEAEAARAEDTLLMERSIANAIAAQRAAEEDERKREEERRRAEERERKQREREEIARQAEAILATI